MSFWDNFLDAFAFNPAPVRLEPVFPSSSSYSRPAGPLNLCYVPETGKFFCVHSLDGEGNCIIGSMTSFRRDAGTGTQRSTLSTAWIRANARPVIEGRTGMSRIQRLLFQRCLHREVEVPTTPTSIPRVYLKAFGELLQQEATEEEGQEL